MPGWEGSDRKSRLPDDWPARRERVMKRDRRRCQQEDPDSEIVNDRGQRICGVIGNQVDHVIPGDDHRLDNLQVLCEPHHRTKSAREGGNSFTPLRRPPETHPVFG